MTGHQESPPRLVVGLEKHHHCLGAQGGPEAASTLRALAGCSLVSRRARLITALEVSEFVNIIKASTPGGEQQARSLQTSARDEFGSMGAVQSPGCGQDSRAQ